MSAQIMLEKVIENVVCVWTCFQSRVHSIVFMPEQALTDADTELDSCSTSGQMRVGGTTPTTHTQLNQFYGWC